MNPVSAVYKVWLLDKLLDFFLGILFLKWEKEWVAASSSVVR